MEKHRLPSAEISSLRRWWPIRLCAYQTIRGRQIQSCRAMAVLALRAGLVRPGALLLAWRPCVPDWGRFPGQPGRGLLPSSPAQLSTKSQGRFQEKCVFQPLQFGISTATTARQRVTAPSKALFRRIVCGF